MARDRKYGKVTLERGSVGEEEPVFVLRGQDLAAVPTLEAYMHICGKLGSPIEHQMLISGTIKRFLEWQKDHPVKVPQSKNAQVDSS